MINTVCDHYPVSIVLARAFALVPFAKLPRELRGAGELAARRFQQPHPNDDTPVFTLLASRGLLPDWCNRRRSKAHQAIPLASSAFVKAAPMLHQLSRDLGVDLGALDRRSGELLLPSVGTRLLYVDDAATAKDDEGRFVIPDRQFVTQYAVRTVFGTATSFPSGLVLFFLFFTNERVSRLVLERLGALAGLVRAGVQSKARKGALFAGLGTTS